MASGSLSTKRCQNGMFIPRQKECQNGIPKLTLDEIQDASQTLSFAILGAFFVRVIKSSFQTKEAVRGADLGPAAVDEIITLTALTGYPL